MKIKTVDCGRVAKARPNHLQRFIEESVEKKEIDVRNSDTGNLVPHQEEALKEGFTSRPNWEV